MSKFSWVVTFVQLIPLPYTVPQLQAMDILTMCDDRRALHPLPPQLPLQTSSFFQKINYFLWTCILFTICSNLLPSRNFLSHLLKMNYFTEFESFRSLKNNPWRVWYKYPDNRLVPVTSFIGVVILFNERLTINWYLYAESEYNNFFFRRINSSKVIFSSFNIHWRKSNLNFSNLFNVIWRNLVVITYKSRE